MLTFGLYAWQLILYTTGIDDVVVRYYQSVWLDPSYPKAFAKRINHYYGMVKRALCNCYAYVM